MSCWDCFMDWINKNGDLFSFIGLFLTILTFIGIFLNNQAIERLNKKNFKINRMPENLRDLILISNTLSDLCVNFEENKKLIKKDIYKIIPVLKSLKKSLNHNELDSVKTLWDCVVSIDYWHFEGKFNLIHRLLFTDKIMTEDLVTDVENMLTRLITDIQNIELDSKRNLL